MKFLIDASLSPRLANELRSKSHDAIHAEDLHMSAAPDEQILETARRDERILVAGDSDFGTILASTHATTPSIVYIRGTSGRRVDALVSRITDSLSTIEGPLQEGSIVVLQPGSIRVRALPIL